MKFMGRRVGYEMLNGTAARSCFIALSCNFLGGFCVGMIFIFPRENFPSMCEGSHEKVT